MFVASRPSSFKAPLLPLIFLLLVDGTPHGHPMSVTVSHPYAMENLLMTGWWFQPTPLKNDGVRQLG